MPSFVQAGEHYLNLDLISDVIVTMMPDGRSVAYCDARTVSGDVINLRRGDAEALVASLRGTAPRSREGFLLDGR